MIAHPRALRPRRRPATSTCFTRELKRPSNTATADPSLTVAAPSASRLQVPDLRQLCAAPPFHRGESHARTHTAHHCTPAGATADRAASFLLASLRFAFAPCRRF